MVYGVVMRPWLVFALLLIVFGTYLFLSYASPEHFKMRVLWGAIDVESTKIKSEKTSCLENERDGQGGI